MSGARGLTLVECLVGAVVSAILAGAALGLVLTGQRAALALTRALDRTHNAGAAAAVLRAELQAASALELVALSDSAVAVRALRAAGVICDVDTARGLVSLDASLFSAFRAIDPQRDSVRILADGDPDRGTDDSWRQFGIASVGAGACPGGGPAHRLALAGAAAALSGVAPGAPVRLVEVVEYRSYRDAEGERWLGVRSPASGGWSASSPLAGPLAHPGGFVLRHAAAGGGPAPLADSVRELSAWIVTRSSGAAPFGVRRLTDTVEAVVAIAGPVP